MIQLRNLLCVHFTNWLFLRRDVTREHEKQRKIDQEKIQQLDMLLIDRIEAKKNKKNIKGARDGQGRTEEISAKEITANIRDKSKALPQGKRA